MQISLIIVLLYHVTLCLSKYPAVFIAQNTVCKCKYDLCPTYPCDAEVGYGSSTKYGLKGVVGLKTKKECMLRSLKNINRNSQHCIIFVKKIFVVMNYVHVLPKIQFISLFFPASLQGTDL